MSEVALVALVLFAGGLVHTLVGFGVAMLAMALLSARLGLIVAAPLVALVALTLEAVILARHHAAFDLRAVWRLALGAVVGIPLGVLALRQVPERVLVPILGLVLASYAVYGLWGGRLRLSRNPAWSLGAGALAGLLGGAYNISGPPVIVYGHAEGWPPATFKSNLQGFFAFADLVVVLGHAAAGNLAGPVTRLYLVALPAIGLGLLVGFLLEGRVPPAVFRKLTLGLLLVLGGWLIA